MKSKSLTFRIFINTFFVGTFIYFICAFLFISNMYGYFEKQIFLKLLLHPNKFSIGKAISLTQYVLKTQNTEY